ncbi:MAG: PAS domain-containing protein [Cyclobacteriaceae bacterium]|nr:PAS domain-containing protein [Cyclobacteriaceae bacterium]
MEEFFSQSDREAEAHRLRSLESMLNCLKQGIVHLDGNLNFVFISPMASSLFRCNPKDVIDKNIIDVLKEPADLQCIQYCCEVLSLGSEASFEDYSPLDEKWYRYNFQCVSSGGVAIVIQQIDDPLELLKARAKVMEDEKLMREFQIIAQTGFWTYDLHKNHLYWSDEIYKIFEIEPETFDLSYSGFLDLVHPEDRLKVDAAYQEHLSHKAGYDIIHRIIVSGNLIKYVRERCQTIYDDKGAPLKSLGIISDVSAVMHAQKELIKTKEILDHTSRLAQIGAFEWNLEDNLLYWSPVLREILEVDMQYIPDVEKGLAFYKEGESRKKVEDVVSRAIHQGIPYDVEVELVTPSGFNKWIRSIAQPKMVNGTCKKLSGIIQDITEQKKFNELLRESEDRFRQIFEHTPAISVQGYNCNREVIFWNEASETLYGYRKEEAFGNKIEDLIIPREMHRVVVDNIQRWLDHNEPIKASELILQRKDGSPVHVFSSHIMLRNIYGELEMYCIDIDISDRVELLNTFELQNNNLKEIAWIQSHVLRAPLARLMALLKLMELKGIKLQDQIDPCEKNIDFMQELNKAALEMDNVIKEITLKTYEIKELDKKMKLL